MVRSAPGAGDRDLLAELARRGHADIGPAKLERWRGAGLLWRVVVDQRNGRGSRSYLHAPIEQIANQVEAIAARAWPGRPLDVTAVALVADGFWASDATLRAGHMRNLSEVSTLLTRLLSLGLAAWTGARPRDALGRAEAVAAWMVRQPGKALTFWKRNIARSPDIVGLDDCTSVLTSGVTAAVQLVLTGHASDDGLYEFVTALGLREFVDAIAVAGEDPAAVRSVEKSAKLAGPVLRTSATAGRGLTKLHRALDAPAEQLLAASVLVVELWRVLAQVPALAPALQRGSAPTGVNPPMHTLAVAMLLACTAAEGIDVAPLVNVSLEQGLVSEQQAAAMTDAGAILAAAHPRRR